MGAVWSYPDHVAVDFTSLPPAASNTGRVFKCNPRVAGQGYFYMVSDGTYWRPYGGEQKLYVLDAPIYMAVNATDQLMLSIPIPPTLIPDGRAYIKTFIGVDKLLGTTDTLTTRQRFGPLGTSSDPVLFNPALATTNISGGFTNQVSRLTTTTIRKHGSGSSSSSNALSSSSTVARNAAITVGGLDAVMNYLTVWLQMTTGTTEYGVLHSFTAEIMG